jgi:hypothetical protein
LQTKAHTLCRSAGPLSCPPPPGPHGGTALMCNRRCLPAMTTRCPPTQRGGPLPPGSVNALHHSHSVHRRSSPLTGNLTGFTVFAWEHTASRNLQGFKRKSSCLRRSILCNVEAPSMDAFPLSVDSLAAPLTLTLPWYLDTSATRHRSTTDQMSQCKTHVAVFGHDTEMHPKKGRMVTSA